MLLLCLVEVDLLGDLEITLSDEIHAIDLGLVFSEDFLATYELSHVHVLEDFFKAVCTQIGENPEATEEVDYFFVLAFFLLANGPYVVFLM